MKTLIVSDYVNDEDCETVCWQSWMETELENAIHIQCKPHQMLPLSAYADSVLQALNEINEPTGIIAHGVGCMAAILAALSNVSKIQRAMLVAPTITAPSIYQDTINTNATKTILNCSLPFPSVVVASENDPRTKLMTSAYWAHAWGSHFISIGKAGHIDQHSGYGAWPWGLDLYHRFTTFYNTNDGYKIFSIQHGLIPFPKECTA